MKGQPIGNGCAALEEPALEPPYEERVVEQIHQETDRLGVGKLEDLLKAGDTWMVSEHVPVAN